MDASKSEIIHEVLPWLRVYKDGTIERLAGYEIAPAGLDHQTGVLSKDVIIDHETGVSVRLYRPNLIAGGQKLPLVLYFHGGAYLISSTSDPAYHNSLNQLVAEAKVILASVDYRRAPENPLPAAFDDSWAALKWAGLHASGGGSEAWVNESVDFSRVFLAGDSAGSSIAHHMAVRDEDIGLKFVGMILINPYFWGEVPIGSEVTDAGRKAMVDNWWRFVCPSDRGNDDPLVNPLADGSPALTGLACGRVLVSVAEKDILRDRGVHYYEALGKSEWKGKVKVIEIEGEDHVFHIFNPNGENATKLIKGLADFIHEK